MQLTYSRLMSKFIPNANCVWTTAKILGADDDKTGGWSYRQSIYHLTVSIDFVEQTKSILNFRASYFFNSHLL